MKYTSPESVGISSRDLLKFYKAIDGNHLSTHSVIMARGDSIFTECYYEPFNKDFLHRMYSVSKSFVSIAIGFCEQDGLISLDDPMGVYKIYPISNKRQKGRKIMSKKHTKMLGVILLITLLNLTVSPPFGNYLLLWFAFVVFNEEINILRICPHWFCRGLYTFSGI